MERRERERGKERCSFLRSSEQFCSPCRLFPFPLHFLPSLAKTLKSLIVISRKKRYALILDSPSANRFSANFLRSSDLSPHRFLLQIPLGTTFERLDLQESREGREPASNAKVGESNRIPSPSFFDPPYAPSPVLLLQLLQFILYRLHFLSSPIDSFV